MVRGLVRVEDTIQSGFQLLVPEGFDNRWSLQEAERGQVNKLSLDSAL